MSIDRRKVLFGLIAAPAVIRTPGLLMPVKALPQPMPLIATTAYVNDAIEVLRCKPMVAGELWYDFYERQLWVSDGRQWRPLDVSDNRLLGPAYRQDD